MLGKYPSLIYISRSTELELIRTAELHNYTQNDTLDKSDIAAFTLFRRYRS
jgi:hypothetical protein